MSTFMDFVAPMSGKLLDICNVPYIVFSDRIMGDGFAIDINGSEVVAPLDGTVSVVFPGGHAICINGDNGIQILIHIGLETHGIENIYNIKVGKGQYVKQGDVLVEADYKKIRKKAKSSILPIVFLNKESVRLLKEGQEVNVGENQIIEVMY
jgi:glucose-specific phosphotransferase system IIA component